MKKRKVKIKRKTTNVIKIPKDNIEEIKNFYTSGLSKFKYKTIPEELIPKEVPCLVYYIDCVYGEIMIGLAKKLNEKKQYFEVKEIKSKFEHIGIYEYDQIMLIPQGSKDFEKYERYIK
jgi:hypothetical protein